jgi:hypothetical protein
MPQVGHNEAGKVGLPLAWGKPSLEKPSQYSRRLKTVARFRRIRSKSPCPNSLPGDVSRELGRHSMSAEVKGIIHLG